MSNMSHDRIEFFISKAYGVPTDGLSVNASATIEAAMLAFNVHRSEALKWYKQGWRIVARPSQFARFLVMRDMRGGQNAFKQLEPVHHSSSSGAARRRTHKYKKVVDVSGNPHCKSYYDRVAVAANCVHVSREDKYQAATPVWELDLDKVELKAGETWVSQGGTRIRVKEETVLSGPELVGFRQMGFKKVLP